MNNDQWVCELCGEPSAMQLQSVPLCRADFIRIVIDEFDEADCDMLANT